jgi:CRISPR-associated endonuclease Cas2
MARLKVLDKPRQHITRDALVEHLKNGDILSVAKVSDNVIKVLAERNTVWGNWSDYYPSSIERHAMRLLRRGMVAVEETEIGCIVKLTEKGKTEIVSYKIDDISIGAKAEWDGRWRMVLFDISGETKKYEKVRKIFRTKLKQMGFYQIQKSVYVTPYPCQRQVTYLRDVLNIPKSVKIAIVEHLEDDRALRAHFSLPE